MCSGFLLKNEIKEKRDQFKAEDFLREQEKKFQKK